MKKQHLKLNLNQIKKNPKNPKKHNDELIESSIKELGFVDDVVIDENNIILAGHGRYDALKKLNKKEVDVIKITGWDERQKKKYAILSNKAVEAGGWDNDLLVEEDEELLKEAGFSTEELDDIFDAEPEEKDDQVPDKPKVAKSKLGEVYELGNHRLMCGDATKREDVEKLMNGKKAEFVAIIDPPYGIDVVKGGSIGKGVVCKEGHYNKIIGDKTTQTAKDTYKLLLDIGIDKMIIWGGNYFTEFLPSSPCWLVWDKKDDMKSNNFADCEIAWTNFNTPTRIFKCVWRGMIKQGEHGKRLHPTQKPVELLVDIIKMFTDKNDIVLDLFGGSGSTLIACEKLNRKCYMMELDPLYCDVIRERYNKFIK